MGKKYCKPTNQLELMHLLERLGFVNKKVGKGKHQYKYVHLRRKFLCTHEPPFIIVPHIIYKQFVDKVITIPGINAIPLRGMQIFDLRGIFIPYALHTQLLSSPA